MHVSFKRGPIIIDNLPKIDRVINKDLPGMAKLALVSQLHSIESQIAGYEAKTGDKITPTEGGAVGGAVPPSVQGKGEEKEKGEESSKECEDSEKSR